MNTKTHKKLINYFINNNYYLDYKKIIQYNINNTAFGNKHRPTQTGTAKTINTTKHTKNNILI